MKAQYAVRKTQVAMNPKAELHLVKKSSESPPSLLCRVLKHGANFIRGKFQENDFDLEEWQRIEFKRTGKIKERQQIERHRYF